MTTETILRKAFRRSMRRGTLLALLLVTGTVGGCERYRGGFVDRALWREKARREKKDAEEKEKGGSKTPALKRVRKQLPEDGPLEVRWALDLEDRKVVRFHLPPADLDYAYVLVETDEHDLIAIHRTSGKAVWWTRLGGPILGDPSFTRYNVYLIAKSHLTCLERYSGEAVWRLFLEVPAHYGPVVKETVKDRPTLFVPSLDRRVYAFHVEKIKWPPERGAGAVTRKDFVIERFALRTLWRTAIFGLFTGPILFKDQHLYLNDDSKALYGVQTTEIYAGRPVQAWAYHAREAMAGGPCLLGPYVYAASRDTYVYCVTRREGGLVWKYMTGETLEEGPYGIIDPYTNKITIVQKAGPTGSLLGFADASGEVRWDKPDGIEVVGRLSDPENEIEKRTLMVVRHADGSLSGSYAGNGEEVWRIPVPDFGPYCRNTYVERVFAATDEGRVVFGLSRPR